MVRRTGLAAAALAAAASAFALHPPPEKTVTATKGPIQLTLRLYKTKVKVEKSLWYQIELKNVGKKRILVTDRIFWDPWAMHVNINYGVGIYVEVTAPKGKYHKAIRDRTGRKRDETTPLLRWNAEYPHYDYVDKPLTPEQDAAIKKDVAKKEAEWERQGLSETEKTIKRAELNSSWNFELKLQEDRSKLFWLEPGASTTTFAWAYWDADPYADHSLEGIGEEKQVGDYTQLFSYDLKAPGKHKIRAVYDYSVSAANQRSRRKSGVPIDRSETRVETPPIAFEVVP
jgi:hypothetical protein